MERAVCVLVDSEQVAVVRTRDNALYAVDNLDPVSGAMVMSRGIVGSRADRDVLVSRIHKQAYDLSTGQCLDLPDVRLRVHRVSVFDGGVEIGPSKDIRRGA